MTAILTISFVGPSTNLRYVPLCILCSMSGKPWNVVPVHGKCAKCGSEAGSHGAKKIIKKRLTVR